MPSSASLVNDGSSSTALTCTSSTPVSSSRESNNNCPADLRSVFVFQPEYVSEKFNRSDLKEPELNLKLQPSIQPPKFSVASVKQGTNTPITAHGDEGSCCRKRGFALRTWQTSQNKAPRTCNPDTIVVPDLPSNGSVASSSNVMKQQHYSYRHNLSFKSSLYEGYGLVRGGNKADQQEGRVHGSSLIKLAVLAGVSSSSNLVAAA